MSKRPRLVAEGHTSALARNDPGLLAKTDPALGLGHRRLVRNLPTKLKEPCPRANRGRDADADEDTHLARSRACGADDNEDATPHSELPPQMLFFESVTLTEHKWVILRQRRGT